MMQLPEDFALNAVLCLAGLAVIFAVAGLVNRLMMVGWHP